MAVNRQARVFRLEQYADVQRMPTELLYKHAARCPGHLDAAIRHMTNSQLHKIIDGDFTPLREIK